MLASVSQCQVLLGKDGFALFCANQPSAASTGPSTQPDPQPGPQLMVRRSMGLMRECGMSAGSKDLIGKALP